MKKLVLTLAIVFAGIMSVNAQVWVGGGLDARFQKNYTGFQIAPEVGYMISPKFTIALGADYRFNKTEFAGVTTTQNSLLLQPYFRYVGGTIGHKFSLFADLCADFGLMDAKGSYAVTVQPGVAWQATDKFTVAFRFATVGYDHHIYGTDGFLLDGWMSTKILRFYYTL